MGTLFLPTPLLPADGVPRAGVCFPVLLQVRAAADQDAELGNAEKL